MFIKPEVTDYFIQQSPSYQALIARWRIAINPFGPNYFLNDFSTLEMDDVKNRLLPSVSTSVEQIK